MYVCEWVFLMDQCRKFIILDADATAHILHRCRHTGGLGVCLEMIRVNFDEILSDIKRNQWWICLWKTKITN